MQKSQSNMLLLVKHIQYNKYSWHICGDLKVNFLDSQLNLFSTNLGVVSDDHEKSFHQEISVKEETYQSKHNPSILLNTAGSQLCMPLS
jgi:hypothetical protein